LTRAPGGTSIANQASAGQLSARIATLRDNEPNPFDATPDAIEAYVVEVGCLLQAASEAGFDSISDAQARYLNEAAMRQVRFAHARLERDRHAAIDVLSRIFRLGRPPRPDGRYEGELLGLSTGLLSDPFFEWLTRIYLPWLGKTFDAATSTGDNVFKDNTWSKATEILHWPEYRVHSDDPPGTVRVFPFRSYVAKGIEDPDVDLLRIDYAHSPNPLPVRRIVDEVVELPGGYILGKAHMRGLREFRRVCFFGLVNP
jgi:hypothetical protein